MPEKWESTDWILITYKKKLGGSWERLRKEAIGYGKLIFYDDKFSIGDFSIKYMDILKFEVSKRLYSSVLNCRGMKNYKFLLDSKTGRARARQKVSAILKDKLKQFEHIKIERSISFLKDIPKLYKEISFDDLTARSGLERPEIMEIIERLILDGELKAEIRGNMLILEKDSEIFPFQKALDITRGFEVAGDTFKFFVRVENTLNLALNNVSVKIIPPHTLKLDKKSPSREFLIGDIKPNKFGTAIFYLFCVACADTEINAELDYMDPEGNLQIEKMTPFPIMSCKFVKPRKISVEEFEEEYQAKEKKTIEIKLREDISDEEAVKMIKDRLTMSTVASSSNSLAMSGRARDGSDILLKSVIKEIEGVKTAVASVVSSNQYVTMGVLSDFMETFSEFREEAISKFEVLEKGHEEIKETVIREARKILENQIAEYELLETRNLELQEGIQTLNKKVAELELTGDFSQANEMKQQIESLNMEFRRTSQQLEAKMDEAIENVEKIFAELGKLEDIEIYLKDHLATDWERLKTSWAELKEGTINRKQFIARGLKVVGKRFLKIAWDLAGMFL